MLRLVAVTSSKCLEHNTRDVKIMHKEALKRESNDLMGEVGRGQWLVCIAKRIHAWYISHIYHKNRLNVGVIYQTWIPLASWFVG